MFKFYMRCIGQGAERRAGKIERRSGDTSLVQAYAQLNNRISSQTFIGVLGHPAGARCTGGKMERRSGDT